MHLPVRATEVFQLANFHDCGNSDSSEMCCRRYKTLVPPWGFLISGMRPCGLTRNRKSSDPYPFAGSFPPDPICFSFGETKLFTLFLLWKQGIPEGIAGSINHLNGRVLITSTRCIQPALEKKTLETRVMAWEITCSAVTLKLGTLSVTAYTASIFVQRQHIRHCRYMVVDRWARGTRYWIHNLWVKQSMNQQLTA